ncbi:MAG: hypothetical protein KZQ58_01280 [gamma proteobacterium symbiont of Bathyaustriella thionipta]|nr:hypothetical protein [gamma proteobacterium symbiont of Bathyaustriella thionipta]
MLLLFLWPAAASAINLDNNIQIHGFAGQSFLLSTGNNNFFGDSSSNDGSWDFTEIGVNGSWRPKPNLLFSAQILSRRAGETSSGSLQLDYGLLDYTAFELEQGRAGIRMGRVKNPIGLYNETRDVPATRPSILLPQSVYFDRVRDLEMASDGLQLYVENAMGNGMLKIEGNYGKILVNDEVEDVFVGDSGFGDLDGYGAFSRLQYHYDGERIILSASGAFVDMDFDTHGGASPFSDGGIDIQFYVLSAQYNAEKWSLTAEYVNEPISHNGGLSVIPDFTPEGGYLQGTWRALSDVELLLRYDVSYTFDDDHSGKQAESATGVPAHTALRF